MIAGYYENQNSSQLFSEFHARGNRKRIGKYSTIQKLSQLERRFTEQVRIESVREMILREARLDDPEKHSPDSRPTVPSRWLRIFA